MASNTDKKVAQVWSSGGGVQSTAIAALIYQGLLPKPDLAVISDTGREASTTWAYMRNIVSPALARIGMEIHRIPHNGVYNTVDLWGGKNKDTVLVPMFTSKNNGKAGMMSKFCSNEWKTRPVQRFCREKGIKRADMWIGFTTDEMERMRAYDSKKPWNHVYPLIDDLQLSREDCLRIVDDLGWRPPPRSSCWMCPLRSDEEWLYLKRTAPNDFKKAKVFEREVQKRDPQAHLHRSLKDIGDVEFSDKPDPYAKECNSGMCFT